MWALSGHTAKVSVLQFLLPILIQGLTWGGVSGGIRKCTVSDKGLSRPQFRGTLDYLSWVQPNMEWRPMDTYPGGTVDEHLGELPLC